MSLGAQELIIVLIIVLVLFGGAKLPKLARSLGQAQKEFKQGVADGETSDSAASTPASADKPVDSSQSESNNPSAASGDQN